VVLCYSRMITQLNTLRWMVYTHMLTVSQVASRVWVLFHLQCVVAWGLKPKFAVALAVHTVATAAQGLGLVFLLGLPAVQHCFEGWLFRSLELLMYAEWVDVWRNGAYATSCCCTTCTVPQVQILDYVEYVAVLQSLGLLFVLCLRLCT
jgi:hypothetical protein